MNDANKDRSSPQPPDDFSRTTAELEAMEVDLLAGILALSAHSAQPIQNFTGNMDEPCEPRLDPVPVPQTVVNSAPPAAANPPPTQAQAPHPERPPAAPSDRSIDLLAELRKAASQVKSEGEFDARRQAERKKLMGTAMRQIFDYLNEFARHLDTLKPEVSHVYRLSPQIQLSGLSWTSSFVDYRRVGNAEHGYPDSVSLRFTLASERGLAVMSPPHLSPRLEDELSQVGLRYAMTDRKNQRGGIEAVEFTVSQEVKVSLLFKAEVDDDEIIIRGHNFRGFGRAAYVVAPTAVSRAMLDELGRFLIGRSSEIFSQWKPMAL